MPTGIVSREIPPPSFRLIPRFRRELSQLGLDLIQIEGLRDDRHIRLQKAGPVLNTRLPRGNEDR
jgi:hypothetical protein